MTKTPSPKPLLSATSIGFAAALLCSTATAAYAKDECGALVEGQVSCTPDHQPFDEGIGYDAPGDVIVDLAPGLSITPEPRAAGLLIVSEEGGVTINGAGTNIATRGATGAVAFAKGDININLGTVTSDAIPAELSWGINTFTATGTTRITVDEVRSVGDESFAIIVESITGDVIIDAGLVSTNGFAADTVKIITGGQVNIGIDRIESSGDYVWGVNLFNGAIVDEQVVGGSSYIGIGSIDISGNNNDGVYAAGVGDVIIDVDAIKLSGDSGTGVTLLTDSSGYIHVRDLALDGFGSIGVDAQALGGLNVVVDNAHFTGEGGGIQAFTNSGEARIKVGTLTGDSGAGIIASSAFASAAIDVGTIDIGGSYSVGASARAGEDTARILAGSVTMKGESNTGLWASGLSTLVQLTGPLLIEGHNAKGIRSITTGGEGQVVTAGTLTANGAGATGIDMVARYGTGTIRTAGAVDVVGDRSAGILAFGEGADLKIEAQDIKASGATSSGILARTKFPGFFIGAASGPLLERDGNIDIRAADISVAGDGAIGISAMGLGNSTILAGDVHANASHAIETDMIGTAALDLRGAIRSDAGTAIFAQGRDVTIEIAASSSVSGGQDGILVNAPGERCAMEDPADGSPNPCPVPGSSAGGGGGIGIGAVPIAAADPLALTGAATIVNRGTIAAGEGYAVRADTGSVALTNHGRIEGAVKFVAGDDIFDNRGTFLIAKDSDFGTGVDTLRNSGIVRLATERTAGKYAFTGLERFENSGTIDLRNGAIGDTLTLSGDYRGIGGARLLVDLDTEKGTADRLVVAGAATGSTLVDLAIDASDAVLTDPDGITVVSTGADSAADAFRISPASLEIGFVRYTLVQDGGDYALIGRAGSAAYRQLGAIHAADAVWDASADLWRQNGLGQRDAQLGGQASTTRRLWGAMQGGRVSRDWTSTGAGGTTDLSYRQTRQGGQIGLDLLGRDGDGGALRFGVTAGYTQSDLDYRNTRDEIDLSTGNVGLYAGYVGERLFANLLVKYDRHDIKLKTDALDAATKIDGSTWGADGEMGVRFGNPGLFVEPTVGLAWTRTSVDTLHAGRQQIAFHDSTGVKGRIGARIGGTMLSSDGTALTIYASGHAVHQFGDDYGLELVAGARETIGADRLGTYGEGRIGLSYRTTSGFEAFAESQGEVGGSYDALAGRVGVRIGF
ncbi:outer membrane autotransporter protein [Sphingomonas zeicaulis]|uniref:autotransporter outer membrane beta-barrel domain-containing protein n=1 Tax=Sphingomonas zeicaulis TaxID=1632740 RepID=UPI003D1C5236